MSALDRLAASPIVAVVDIDVSWENRIIRAVKISDNPLQSDPGEPDVLLVGGHHAREWISVEVPLRIAEYIVSHYDTDPQIKALVDSREIWVIPLLNPDGYQHSIDVDRLWRKNRRDLGLGFYGVDLNRNYSYEWGGVGSSGSLDSETYRGPNPFSEPETSLIKEFIEQNGITRLISYHSYKQLIIYPWGYTTDNAPDAPLLQSIAEQMQERIASVHGEHYTVGQVADTLYAASGDLCDWAYGEKGILAFTIELRPEDASVGFMLPPEQIIPTFEENLPAALFFIGLSRGRVMDFENGTDRQPIRSSIPGMTFTTTAGFDWVYGDERLPIYNVQPTPDPSGPYACRGHGFAWLGERQGLGQIDFVDSRFKTFGFSYSSMATMFVEGYDASGQLVDSDSGPGNLGMGLLGRLTINGDIARVLVHDQGNFWLIDDLFVTDALGEAQAQLPGKFARELQVVEPYVRGQSRRFAFLTTTNRRSISSCSGPVVSLCYECSGLMARLRWSGSRIDHRST